MSNEEAKRRSEQKRVQFEAAEKRKMKELKEMKKDIEAEYSKKNEKTYGAKK